MGRMVSLSWGRREPQPWSWSWTWSRQSPVTRTRCSVPHFHCGMLFLFILLRITSHVSSLDQDNPSSIPSGAVGDHERNDRLLFDDLFWFGGGSSSSSDDDDKPGLASCSCHCGVANQETRIVGGVSTGVNRYPWVARLVYNGQFHCGASLLNEDYVLTAAHCVRNLKRSRIRIILGDHNMFTTSDVPAKMRAVASIVRHRNFDVNSYNHDIALLRLRKPVNYTKNIRPVCLPQPDTEFSGKTGTVVGWGRTSEGGALAPVAQQVQVPILSLSECRKQKYRPSRITSNMVCAGKGTQDSCQGDSGGPLLVDTGGDKFILAGIVSWGVGCGREGYPGVYTRVSRYYNWITTSMRDTCLCTS